MAERHSVIICTYAECASSDAIVTITTAVAIITIASVLIKHKCVCYKTVAAFSSCIRHYPQDNVVGILRFGIVSTYLLQNCNGRS